MSEASLMEINPIELEVVKNALLSIAEEMGVVLIRAPPSPLTSRSAETAPAASSMPTAPP